MKKLLALLLVLTLVIGCFAACGEKKPAETTAAKDPVAEQTDATEAKPAEPLEITIIPHNQRGYSITPDGQSEKILEDKYNVKFDIYPIDVYNEEKMGLFWADNQSEEVDVITLVGQNAKNLLQLADQGQLRGFPVEWLDEYMPDYMQELYSRNGEDVIKSEVSNDGVAYCIPYQGLAWPFITGVRQDWLDKLKLDMPTDLASFEACLKAFTEEDPDGNGIDDTYGISSYKGYEGTLLGYVYNVFGTSGNGYRVQEDGSVVNNATTNEYKEALKVIHRWYEAGYIDPEMPTDTRAIQMDKWAQGKLGFIVENCFNFLPSRANMSNSPRGPLLEANPDAVISIVPYFPDENGVVRTTYALPKATNNTVYAFGPNCPDEVIQFMLKMHNDLLTDIDFFLSVERGVEGEQYTRDENGIVTYIEGQNTPENMMSLGIGNCWARVPDYPELLKVLYTEEDLAQRAWSLDVDEINWQAFNFIDKGINQAASDYGADISTTVLEYFYKFMNGELDIDAEWDNYLAVLEKRGIQKVCDEYAKLLAE